jgi:uncharacterized protein
MGAGASIHDELIKPLDASDLLQNTPADNVAEVKRLRQLLQEKEKEQIPLPPGGFDAKKMMRAAQNGDLPTVQSHVAAAGKAGDGKLNTVNEDEETALMLAAAGGHVLVVLALCQAGAALDLTDEYGCTALRNACGAPKSSISEGHTAVVLALCKNGASSTVVCDYGWTPLMKAAEMGYLKICDILLQFNKEVSFINQTEKGGETALDKAKDKEHAEVIELLKNAGAVEEGDN